MTTHTSIDKTYSVINRVTRSIVFVDAINAYSAKRYVSERDHVPMDLLIAECVWSDFRR